MIERTALGRPADAPMFYGLRGVGKTVLLKALQRQADAAGWLTVEIEGKQEKAEQDLTRQRLARGLVSAARSLRPSSGWTEAWRRALGAISSFSLGVGATGIQVGLDVEPRRGVADTGDPTIDLEEVLRDLTPALVESGVG